MSVSRRARSSPRRPQRWVESGAGRIAIHDHAEGESASCCIAIWKHGEIIVTVAKKLHDLNMAFGIARGLAIPMLIINFILYLVTACLAGWALNRNFDSNNKYGENEIGDSITTIFLPVALIACMVGLASSLAGIHHIFVWRSDSLAVAGSTSLITWLLTLLAMGMAAKEIERSIGYRPPRLKVIEALMVILSLFQLIYFLALHGPVLRRASIGFRNPQQLGQMGHPIHEFGPMGGMGGMGGHGQQCVHGHGHMHHNHGLQGQTHEYS